MPYLNYCGIELYKKKRIRVNSGYADEGQL